MNEPKEWTPWHEAQGSYIPQSVCDKHNAELAAERLNAKAWELTCKGKEGAYVKMEQQLAAERIESEMERTCLNEWITELQQELATEREQWQLAVEDCHRKLSAKVQQLDAERNHRAATQVELDGADKVIANLKQRNKTLVEALQKLRDCDFVITPKDRMDAVRDIARAALAKAKEGK